MLGLKLQNSLLLGLCLSIFATVGANADNEKSDNTSFSMKVMDVFSITGRGVVMTGRVATGILSVGDTICVPLVSGETSARPVEGIELFRKMLERAEAGQNVGILINGIDKESILKGGQLHGNCELEVATQ
ncbi:MAG: EF-Tu/IF-2/RF-3 family GTPase [Lysobacterales bacterium]